MHNYETALHCTLYDCPSWIQGNGHCCRTNHTMHLAQPHSLCSNYDLQYHYLPMPEAEMEDFSNQSRARQAAWCRVLPSSNKCAAPGIISSWPTGRWLRASLFNSITYRGGRGKAAASHPCAQGCRAGLVAGGTRVAAYLVVQPTNDEESRCRALLQCSTC
jgi:hypothetical protein